MANDTTHQKKILVIGSSHVRHIKEHIATKKIIGGNTISIGEMKLMGFSGLGAKTFMSDQYIQDKVRAYSPDIVVIVLGGNDLDQHSAPDMFEVLDNIIEVVRWHKGEFNCSIAVMKLFKRQWPRKGKYAKRYPGRKDYNDLLWTFNAMLTNEMEVHDLGITGKFLNVWSPSHFIDDVHLTLAMYSKLFRKIKDAAFKANKL